jgi:hypothetical protein
MPITLGQLNKFVKQMLIKKATYLKEVNNLKWVCSVSPDISLGPKICHTHKKNDNKLTNPDKNKKPQSERECKKLLYLS